MKYVPSFYRRNNAPKIYLEIVGPIEEKFGINFSAFYFFSENLLNKLHKKIDLKNNNYNIIVTSETNNIILDVFPVLTKIANSDLLSIEQSKQYLDALLNIYGSLPRKPNTFDQETLLTIAPEREGRILADQMKWLTSNTITPHFKRVHFRGGLIIGLVDLDINRSYEKCNIVDGAIASGATIISIMDLLKDRINSFSIFSVHSSYQGLYAIIKYANTLNIEISITVGHVTDGLNSKYYAIQETQPSHMQVGDLGDILSKFPNSKSNIK